MSAKQKQQGITLVECLFVLVIIGILAGTIAWGVGSAREKSRAAVCLMVSKETWRDLVWTQRSPFPSCPNQLAVHSEDFPDRRIDYCGYAYNRNLSHHIHSHQGYELYGSANRALEYPALTVLAFDARAGILSLRSPDAQRRIGGIWRSDLTAQILAQPPGSQRHQGGANYVFADGHASWLRPSQLFTQRHADGVHLGFGI